MRLLLGLVLLTGCTASSVRSSGLVPHAQPSFHSGQPIATERRTATGTLGVTDIIRSHAPRVAADADAGGIVVPRTHIQGGFRAQVYRWLDFGILYDQGPAEAATRANQDHPPVDDRDTIGLAYSMQGTSPVGGVPGLGIGVVVQAWVYSVPYVSYRSCVARCWVNDLTNDPDDVVTHGRELMFVLNLGLRPSYKRGPITLFGLIEGRTQPTIMAPRVELDRGEEEPVEPGSLVTMVGGGVELDLPGGVKLLMQGYQPLGAKPIDYGTTLAASLVVPFYSEPFSVAQPAGSASSEK